MARRRERPVARINPSGEKVWVARATDPSGQRRYRGTFKLRREAKDAIDAAYEEWKNEPTIRQTVGDYAADWTERHPRSQRTNCDRHSKLRQVLDVEIEGRALRDWSFPEFHRSHARDLVDHMLRHQGRAAGGASAILRVLSAMADDAIDACVPTRRAGHPAVVVRGATMGASCGATTIGCATCGTPRSSVPAWTPRPMSSALAGRRT